LENFKDGCFASCATFLIDAFGFEKKRSDVSLWARNNAARIFLIFQPSPAGRLVLAGEPH
jgi:hypothetical protein